MRFTGRSEIFHSTRNQKNSFEDGEVFLNSAELFLGPYSLIHLSVEMWLGSSVSRLSDVIELQKLAVELICGVGAFCGAVNTEVITENSHR